MSLSSELPPEHAHLYDIALIPAAVALNLAIATAVSALRLPLYLDAIGTIAVVLMSNSPGRNPMWAGIFVGVFSFVVMALFINPTIVWFSHVQAAIAVYAFYVIRPLTRPNYSTFGFGGWSKVVAAGIGLGITAAVLSAPVAAVLFSGITPNGPGAVVALLLASGQNLYRAVLTGGLSIEPIDKTMQTVLAVSIYLASPWKRRTRS